jgi:hypothetical protein
VIALELGVTSSRVSQIMRTEKRMARRILMLTTVLPEYHADPEASLLEIAWITL